MTETNIENFLKKINKNKKIILSVDVDNTLVNREKGNNYIYHPTLLLLKKILDEESKIVFLPNTGRDFIGFQSLSREGLKIKNAVLGSGSIVFVDGKLIFNEKSRISRAVIGLLSVAIESGLVPFADFTFVNKRIIFFSAGRKYKVLFFSQNPRDWFDTKLPESYNIADIKNHLNGADVFRIEFPIFTHQVPLYTDLINKKENCIDSFARLLQVNIKKLAGYSLKRKVFFNEIYHDKAIFARLEKHSDFTNKGEGLKKWLSGAKLRQNDITIIHIGDRDSGVVNDTLIKKTLPGAFVVMVGEKCQLNNPVIDLYLRNGNVDMKIYNFIKALLEII